QAKDCIRARNVFGFQLCALLICQLSMIIVVVPPLIGSFPCSSRLFLSSSAFFHAHRGCFPANRQLSMLIAVVLPLIGIFPCSSRLFFRSSTFFRAHRGCSSAHQHFSMLIAVVLPLIGSFPCSSVVSAGMA